jgi:hypothetical protein
MIQLLKKNIDGRQLRNVEVILGTPTDPKLPKNAIDLVLVVDVNHEFTKPVTMMRISNPLRENNALESVRRVRVFRRTAWYVYGRSQSG